MEAWADIPDDAVFVFGETSPQPPLPMESGTDVSPFICTAFPWPALNLPDTVFFFRTPSDKPDSGWVDRETEDDAASEEMDPRESILCRRCLFAVTHPDLQISVNGSHRHTFANPSGIVYEIGCYRTADGSVQAGPASTEFTWFSGYSWRISYCRSCATHLGWHFSSHASHNFHGLIVDRLVFPG